MDRQREREDARYRIKGIACNHQAAISHTISIITRTQHGDCTLAVCLEARRNTQKLLPLYMIYILLQHHRCKSLKMQWQSKLNLESRKSWTWILIKLDDNLGNSLSLKKINRMEDERMKNSWQVETREITGDRNIRRNRQEEDGSKRKSRVFSDFPRDLLRGWRYPPISPHVRIRPSRLAGPPSK